MIIYPGIGLDFIKFGLSESEAIKLLGKPDKSYFLESESHRLQYNTHQIELSFEPDNDNLLGWIEVHNHKALLFGSKLFNLEKEEIAKFLSKHIDEEPEIDDYGSFVSLTYDILWLELQFQFNKLQNINFGVLYNESDKPLWPAT